MKSFLLAVAALTVSTTSFAREIVPMPPGHVDFPDHEECDYSWRHHPVSIGDRECTQWVQIAVCPPLYMEDIVFVVTTCWDGLWFEETVATFEGEPDVPLLVADVDGAKRALDRAGVDYVTPTGPGKSDDEGRELPYPECMP